MKKVAILRETGEHRCENSLFFTANSRVRRDGVPAEMFTHILLSRQNPYRVNLFGEYIHICVCVLFLLLGVDLLWRQSNSDMHQFGKLKNTLRKTSTTLSITC